MKREVSTVLRRTLELNSSSRVAGILLLILAFFTFGTAVSADPIPTYMMTSGSIGPVPGGALGTTGTSGPLSFGGPMGNFTGWFDGSPMYPGYLIAPGSTQNLVFLGTGGYGVGGGTLSTGSGSMSASGLRFYFDLNGSFNVPNTIAPSLTLVFPVIASSPFGPNNVLIEACSAGGILCGGDPNTSLFFLNLQGQWVGSVNLQYDASFGTYDISSATFQLNPVPEPTTLLLLGTGIAGLWLKRRKGN